MRELIGPATEADPAGLKIDVVAFGCTSASMALGEEEVFRRIVGAAGGGVHDAGHCAGCGLWALGARRIGALTPYSAEVNATVRGYLRARGVEVAAFGTFDKRDDRDAARISLDLIEAGVRRWRAAPGWMRVRFMHKPAAGRAVEAVARAGG